MTKSKWGAAALLVAAFVAGGLAGGAAVALADRREPPGRPRGVEGYVNRLAEDLSLTPAQQDSVRAILDRHRPRMDSLWREMGPRFETLRGEVRSEIRAQLDSDQQRRYAELLQEREQREAKRHARPPE